MVLVGAHQPPTLAPPFMPANEPPNERECYRLGSYVDEEQRLLSLWSKTAFVVPGAGVARHSFVVLRVTDEKETTERLVGQVDLATFPNAAGLEAIGGNLFTETASSGIPTAGIAGQPGFGSILQGSLEASNVNVVQEITALITAQRAYEMNAQVIKAADEMQKTATNI